MVKSGQHMVEQEIRERGMKITVFRADGSHEHPPESELPGLLATCALPSCNDMTLWLDLTGPTKPHIHIMRDLFHFHPLAIEDTQNQDQRPKVEEYGSNLFIILNPIKKTPDTDDPFRELDVFVGRNFVVTVHPRDEPITLEVHDVLTKQSRTNGFITASYLLYMLMDTVIDDYLPILDYIDQKLDALEDAILSDIKHEHQQQLFRLKRMVTEMYRIVWPQRDILNNLVNHRYEYIDHKALKYNLRDVSDHLMWVSDHLTTIRDQTNNIANLYMAVSANRLNLVVNRLTILTMTIGALSVIVGFYGMNFERTFPAYNDPNGVPYTLVLMGTVIIIGLVAAYRRRKNQ
jgi:magnesium transporter